MLTSELLNKLEKKQKKYTSKRMQAIFDYAIDEVEERHDIEEYQNNIKYKELKEILLNGAENWREYSFGGCSLIYNSEIVARLPKSFKRYKNNGTKLLEIQANYLHNALFEIYKVLCNE